MSGKARKIALKHLHSALSTILPHGQMRHRVKDVVSELACSMPKRVAQGNQIARAGVFYVSRRHKPHASVPECHTAFTVSHRRDPAVKFRRA